MSGVHKTVKMGDKRQAHCDSECSESEIYYPVCQLDPLEYFKVYFQHYNTLLYEYGFVEWAPFIKAKSLAVPLSYHPDPKVQASYDFLARIKTVLRSIGHNDGGRGGGGGDDDNDNGGGNSADSNTSKLYQLAEKISDLVSKMSLQ